VAVLSARAAGAFALCASFLLSSDGGGGRRRVLQPFGGRPAATARSDARCWRAPPPLHRAAALGGGSALLPAALHWCRHRLRRAAACGAACCWARLLSPSPDAFSVGADASAMRGHGAPREAGHLGTYPRRRSLSEGSCTSLCFLLSLSVLAIPLPTSLPLINTAYLPVPTSSAYHAAVGRPAVTFSVQPASAAPLACLLLPPGLLPNIRACYYAAGRRGGGHLLRHALPLHLAAGAPAHSKRSSCLSSVSARIFFVPAWTTAHALLALTGRQCVGA